MYRFHIVDFPKHPLGSIVVFVKGPQDILKLNLTVSPYGLQLEFPDKHPAICLYRKSEAKSEVKDEDDPADAVKQQSDDSDAESGNKSEANVDADVRDIRYNLETLSCDKLVLCFPLIYFVFWNVLKHNDKLSRLILIYFQPNTTKLISRRMRADFLKFSLHAQERSERERTGIGCEGHHMGVRQGAPAESVKSLKLSFLTNNNISKC